MALAHCILSYIQFSLRFNTTCATTYSGASAQPCTAGTFHLRHWYTAVHCCTAQGKSGSINILESTCGKINCQETNTYTDDIRGSMYVTQSTHPSLTDTNFTKACATSQFSAPTEALPNPTNRNLECVLCTLQGRGCTNKRKTQTRSRTHPCHGKAVSINYSVHSLRFPVCNAHEPIKL